MPEQPRMERESRLHCDGCGADPYVLFRRQIRQADGQLSVVFESLLWPAHPNVAPPRDPTKITCPDCGEELRRIT